MDNNIENTDINDIADVNEQIAIRIEKLKTLKENGNDPFAKTIFDVSAFTAEIKDNFETMEGQNVSIAGRIMGWRDMGKANFIDIADAKGRIQVYVKIDDIGQENFENLKLWDIGDIIGITGLVFRTKRGEISIHSHSLTLLSKSLRQLPEKWHGLTDTEIRYRQRYVDLIANPDVRKTFYTRSKIMTIIRKILDKRGYLEVETPVLHIQPTNANARPFKTHHNTLDIPMYLRVELELALKRLIVGGIDRVYEIGRIFRNEGMSVKHNPEFTMIELYEAYTDYNGMMAIAEEIFMTIADELFDGNRVVNYQGVEIDFSKSFERITMIDAVKKYANVDFNEIQTDEEAVLAAKKAGVEFPAATRGDIINAFFEEFAEEKLIQPTFVTDYPVEISPLTKRTSYDQRLTERFELFMYGREMGNAYSELNDPIDQRKRFVEQAKIKYGEGEFEIDEDFIMAIEYGMPPTGGMGIGIDRLVMLFTDSASIRDVLFFPTMKPINENKN